MKKNRKCVKTVFFDISFEISVLGIMRFHGTFEVLIICYNVYSLMEIAWKKYCL